MNKRFATRLTVALATLALALGALGVLASTSSGAPKAQRNIGLVVRSDVSGAPYLENGGQAAAAALGDQLTIKEAPDPPTQTRAIESLIAQHVAAIAVDNVQGDPAVSQALAKARKAGIPTLSFDKRYAGSVWVSPSSPAQYAHTLADALASQMQRRGQYLIVPCRPANAIVGTYVTLIKAYVQHRYPRMHRVGVIYGGDGNGPAGSLLLRPLLRKHPHLRGLVFLCQDEAYNGPPQLIHLHKVGKVFSSGNGSYYAPPVVEPWLTSVRLGVEQIVIPGDPAKLGYLTVWAADYLGAHYKLVPGRVPVGGPVGTVHYYLHHQELRLGRPLTITKANLAQYTG
jgi:ABC-type sugar transport system substrate-binding protein